MSDLTNLRLWDFYVRYLVRIKPKIMACVKLSIKAGITIYIKLSIMVNIMVSIKFRLKVYSALRDCWFVWSTMKCNVAMVIDHLGCNFYINETCQMSNEHRAGLHRCGQCTVKMSLDSNIHVQGLWPNTHLQNTSGHRLVYMQTNKQR